MENLVIENIKSRRSIRSFQNQPLPKEVVEKIIEAGRFAPSSLNRQLWKFIIITNQKVIEELSQIAIDRIKKLYKLMPILRLFSKDLRDQRIINAIKKTADSCVDTVFYNAPLLIFVANDTRFSGTKEESYLAAGNMILAAHSLGIGSCFIGRGRSLPRKLLLKKFNLPSFYDVNVHLAFGYPKESPKTAPTRRADNVQWV